MAERKASDIEWFLEGQAEIADLAEIERSQRPVAKRPRLRPFLANVMTLAIGVAFVAVMVGAVLVAIAWLVVERSSQDLVVSNTARISPADVVIVPGDVGFDNEHSAALVGDRVDFAVALYNSDKVSHLLVSGDEWRNRAISQQVLATDITLDRASADTWRACVRAHDEFGPISAVIVTQKRYADRTAALCEAAGLDISVLAIEPPLLPTRTLWLDRATEPLARVWALPDLIGAN